MMYSLNIKLLLNLISFCSQVVMRQSKLPLSLLNDRAQSARVHILDTEGFETTFGPKAQRKRPNLKAADVQV